MHDILKFHHIHGTGLDLSEGGGVATRKEDFCNGIAFGAQPLKIGQKVCVEVVHAVEWSGALRLGVTSHDPGKSSPADLPRYVCPDLTNKEGYWARALDENYADTGNRITFYVNSLGQMNYFVNNEHKGVLLNHLPTTGPLWVLFDIYGNTNAIKFVNADEAPVEILARGPEAMQAYHAACESGTQPVFRTRLMLVGQDRVGKTSLKKALIGLRHDQAEASTDGIDLSASCSFNLRDRQAWKVALRGGFEHPERIEEELVSIRSSGALETLEEEYHVAIATNIVQELLYRKKQKEKQNEQHKQICDKKQQPRSGAKKSTSGPENKYIAKPATSPRSANLRDHELLQEVPDRVVELVEQMMKEKQNKLRRPESSESLKAQNGRNIMLNIWDFAGQAVYYTTHQVFLSARAVYVIVFNLCHDLEEANAPGYRGRLETPRDENDELSSLDYMDLWMNSIHAHTAQNTRNSVDNTTLSPPIFIVGTHRNGLTVPGANVEDLVERKFAQIRRLTQTRSYRRHLVPTFYAVENSLYDCEDEQVLKLRRHIEEVASKESYMGEQIPLKWLKFEKAITGLVEFGTNFTALDMIQEVAKEEGITSEEELKTMLEFYHDLGVIVYYGGLSTLDTTLRNTVILKPQWLIDMFKHVCTARAPEQPGQLAELWHRLDTSGILEERLIDVVWKEDHDQKSALLGLMDKFDLIAERISPKTVTSRAADRLGRSFFVPSRLQRYPEHPKLYSPSFQDVLFFLDFNGFLPDGLYHRLVTRCVCWSQDCGGHEPKLHYRAARFFLDSEHDFVLEMAPLCLARVKVVIIRVVDLDEPDDDSSESDVERTLPPPKPGACAKVRNFLESSLAELRELWMKRVAYRTVVECYCDRPCPLHATPRCLDNQCLHFLNLDECIANKIVCCEHRRIKTSVYRKWFPEPTPTVKSGAVLTDEVIKRANQTRGNIEATQGPILPSWVKSAAKLLNGGSDGQDWLALAKKFGYKKNKIEKLNDDLNPGLALITDWIISSGNTPLSVDMMVTYLEQLQREDIVEIIQKGQEDELEPAQVFISYQWDTQDEVTAIRDRLEKVGFTCWMDIGQMGGGDQLYSRIDEGIRNCKVVLACLSPKYIVSHYCNKEVCLADLLRKPIIPIMVERVPWPPPGGMALMFSQLVYINMKGVGGHGGSGIHADLENKYQEIAQRLGSYATPSPHPLVDVSPRTEVPQLSTLLSGVSVRGSGESLNSQNATDGSLFIPGYQSDYSGSVRAPPLEPLLHRNSGPSTSRAQSPLIRNGVEQVHVNKCAVCSIL